MLCNRILPFSVLLLSFLLCSVLSQTLEELPQDEGTLSFSLTLNFSVGVASPYLPPAANFNPNCYNIRKGFPSGFWIGVTAGAGFKLVACNATTSLKCWRRIACTKNCLLAKSCLDTSGQNRCLRAFECPKPCDSFSYQYENSDFGVSLVSSPNGGFSEVKCTTSEGDSCITAVDCTPSTTGTPSMCLTYQHCIDPTGGKKCLRPVPCFCEGKFKFINVDSGVQLVPADQGFSIKKCKNGCLDLRSCSGQGCYAFKECVSPASAPNSCQRMVPCDYIPPPEPCNNVTSLKATKVFQGIQYVPVDGPGISLVPCPGQVCYDVKKCEGTSADGQPCLKKIDCVSNDGSLSCLQESPCAQTTTTTTTTTTTKITTGPCTSNSNLMVLPAAKGITYQASTNGFSRVPCPSSQGCFEKVNCTSSATAASCIATKACKSSLSNKSCLLEVPCCPKSVQRKKSKSGVMFIQTTQPDPTLTAIQFSSCGNPNCYYMEPCKWTSSSPCFTSRRCPDPLFPDVSCETLVSCADSCNGAIKLKSPSDVTKLGIVLMTQDTGIEGIELSPCPHIKACFTPKPCKFNPNKKVQTCYEHVKCDTSSANGCKVLVSCNT